MVGMHPCRIQHTIQSDSLDKCVNNDKDFLVIKVKNVCNLL